MIYYILKYLQISENYKGVRLASGQDIFSHQLVLDPCFMVPPPLTFSLESLQGVSLRDVNSKVARGICITKHSLVLDVKNSLLVYPPRSKHSLLSISVCYQNI